MHLFLVAFSVLGTEPKKSRLTFAARSDPPQTGFPLGLEAEMAPSQLALSYRLSFWRNLVQTCEVCVMTNDRDRFSGHVEVKYQRSL